MTHRRLECEERTASSVLRVSGGDIKLLRASRLEVVRRSEEALRDTSETYPPKCRSKLQTRQQATSLRGSSLAS